MLKHLSLSIPLLQFAEFVPELCCCAINPEENLQNLFTLSVCCNKIPLCPKIRSDHIKLHNGILSKYPEYRLARLLKENKKKVNAAQVGIVRIILGHFKILFFTLFWILFWGHF